MMMGETLGRSGQSIEGPEWQNLWQISVPKKCCVPHGSTYFLRSYLTDLTHQIGPQRHPEKILGSKKRMLFLDVFCLPNASRNPQVVAAFIRVLKNSDASPRLRTTCLDPGRRRNSSRWASMGTSVASGDAPWLAEYEHHIFQRGRSTTNQKRVTSVVIV